MKDYSRGKTSFKKLYVITFGMTAALALKLLSSPPHTRHSDVDIT